MERWLAAPFANFPSPFLHLQGAIQLQFTKTELLFHIKDSATDPGVDPRGTKEPPLVWT